ncbi:MAG: histidinol-phosphate transaminase [Betaproteobacteria bacterium]|nr:histidinol-phosphate transaminase [Betaproteobacteria bacterium]
MTHAAPVAPDYVRGIAPYVPGKPIDDVARELHLDPAKIVKLASNENPRGPSPGVLAAIAAAALDVTRYPDGFGYHLKDALAKRLSVAPAQLVLGNGSNDILELATMGYLRPGEAAVYAQHAFAVYPLATHARGARGIEVPARDLAHDLPAMRAAITPDTRVVFVANPNNPTGTWLAPAALEAFVDAVPRDVLVVLDEAYNEFLDPADRADSIGWLAQYPHLLVSRTFSKAYGLAALRIGYAVASVEIADTLNRVRQPFNVNALAQAAAIAALADDAYVEESRVLNRQGLAQLYAGLAALGVAYVPSHGNFLLVKVGDAARVNQALLHLGVIVRPVASYGLPEYLRVSVGLSAENERFLAALKSVLGR